MICKWLWAQMATDHWAKAQWPWVQMATDHWAKPQWPWVQMATDQQWRKADLTTDAGRHHSNEQRTMLGNTTATTDTGQHHWTTVPRADGRSTESATTPAGYIFYYVAGPCALRRVDAIGPTYGNP